MTGKKQQDEHNARIFDRKTEMSERESLNKLMKKDLILLSSIDEHGKECGKPKLTLEARETTASQPFKARVILQQPEEEVPSNPTAQQFSLWKWVSVLNL